MEILDENEKDISAKWTFSFFADTIIMVTFIIMIITIVLFSLAIGSLDFGIGQH